MRQLRPTPLVAAVFGLGLLASALAPAMVAQGTTASKASGPLHRRVLAQGRHLREALTLDTQMTAGTLHEMRARSPITVVGRVIAVQCRPSAAGDRLETAVGFIVHDVVRGPLRPGQLIFIVIPGGGFRFPDGADVVQYVPDYRPPHTDARYAFMLQAIPGRTYLGHATFELSVGTEGQFELDGDGNTVTPGARHIRDPIRSRYLGMAVAPFLTELHQGASRR